MDNLNALIQEIRTCQLCATELPMGSRPVIQLSDTARILIAGQAPGIRVHKSGVPFDDPSGDRLRDWMGIDKSTFYDPQRICILPMGFCYPGTGKSGDLPPRPECAEKWRKRLISQLTKIELTIVIGQYAQDWHLQEKRERNLTETVKQWQKYWPNTLPLPHPSPRNNLWLKKNPWMTKEVIPALQERVKELI